MTQEYINGYISAVNNLIFVQRNRLAHLRKHYYKWVMVGGMPSTINRDTYKTLRKEIFSQIKILRDIKLSYAHLIKKINKLAKKAKSV